MWAAIGAALKKLGVAALTSKKGLKIVGGIVLGIIIVIISPILVILALFGGYEEAPPDFFRENVMSQLDTEQFGEIAAVGDTMIVIETKMIEAGYSEDDIEAANLIYTTSLSQYKNEENFVDRFVACFADNETDDDLINKVNTEFGTAISVDEFRQILGRPEVSEPTTSDTTSETASQSISETTSQTGG